MITFSSHKPQEINQKTSSVLKKVQENISKNSYAFFDILNDDSILSEVEQKALELRKNFKNFVILGTGGSSLGAKTLCDLKSNPFSSQDHQVHFLNNVDSHTIEKLLHNINLEQTCFVSVSKSGATSETLFQTLCIMKYLESKVIDVKSHFVFITEAQNSPLTQLAETYRITPLNHHKSIGGRFSVFSNVGLLPAALMGVNIRALHSSAKAYIDDFKQADLSHPALEGAIMAYHEMNSGKSISVMMPYVDRLASFAQWYVQLWAESLGKQGNGSTPIASLGTVDQHSQLQLYNDGPNDKIFTFIVENSKGKGLVPNAYVYTDSKLSYFENQTMGDLLYAEANATIDSLKNVKRPVRVISFDQLDENVLGQLLAHFMLETIITAEFMEINAFDQPGVEQSKILTRQYLAEKKAS